MAAFWPIRIAQIILIVSYPIRKKSRFWLFCMWSVKEKYHALFPKTDYRDKGRGHERRLGWLGWLGWLTRRWLGGIVWLGWLGWSGWLGCLGWLGWLGRLEWLGWLGRYSAIHIGAMPNSHKLQAKCMASWFTY